MRDHEPRHQLIARRRQHRLLQRVRCVVDIQRSAESGEEDSRRNRDDQIEPQPLGRLLLIGGGEIALDHRLIAGVGHQVGEEEANHQHPGDHVRATPAPVEDVKFVGHLSRLDHRRQSAHILNRHDQAQQRATDQHENLQHIGPDHRRDATEHGVDRRQQPHQGDAQVGVHRRHRRQRDRRQQQHDSHPSQLEQDEDGAGEHPYRHRKARFQVLVGSRHIEAPKQRQEAVDHQQHHR